MYLCCSNNSFSIEIIERELNFLRNSTTQICLNFFLNRKNFSRLRHGYNGYMLQVKLFLTLQAQIFSLDHKYDLDFDNWYHF